MKSGVCAVAVLIGLLAGIRAEPLWAQDVNAMRECVGYAS